MSRVFNVAGLELTVGNKSQFAIDIVIHPLVLSLSQLEELSIITLTDGMVAIYIDGHNLLELEGQHENPDRLTNYSSLSLSMLLEWVYYDRAYDVDSRQHTFSDISAGDASPPIQFRLFEGQVKVEWDFAELSRHGRRYAYLNGCRLIPKDAYLICLATAAECLLSAIEWRALSLGRSDHWHAWLSGYLPERRAFHKHMMSVFGSTSAGRPFDDA